MKIYSIFLLAVISLLMASCVAKNEEATIIVKAQNLDGRELSYHRSYNGVYLSTFTPVSLDADSTFTITIPTNGVESFMLLATDPNKKLPSIHKRIYVLPGTTEITINPNADKNIAVMPPTGNELDSEAAESADSFYDLWIAPYIGRKDALGLWADTIPTDVTAKLKAYADSINEAYIDASPLIRKSLECDSRLGILMVYNGRTVIAKRKGWSTDGWDQELRRLRNEVDMSDPINARYPYFAELVTDFYFKDVYPDGNFPNNITSDSLLQLKTDYFLNTLTDKAAEAAIGTMIYNDGANNVFSPSIPDLTERFKTVFPQSGLIPLLDEKAEINKAFNNPEPSPDIVFLDNSEIKTLADLLAPYKGTPVLIDVWATWCRPCCEGFSHVGPIQEYAAENGVQLLYLSIDEQPNIEEKWKRMAQYYKLKGHHILINPDYKMEVFSTFGNNGYLGIPRFAIVDREGNINVCPQALSEIADFTPLRALLDQTK
ncbi:MAG: redoxin family protein [Muribaculaceae bacterium]|nr:redoxin family protein [Muribaculaceae bacterium]